MHGAPFWVTVKVCPATLNVPVRAVVAVLAVALNATVPLPLPLAPDVIVNQDVVVEAVQAHPEAALTPTLPVDAVEARVALVPDKVGGAHGADTVNVFESGLDVDPPGPIAAIDAW